MVAAEVKRMHKALAVIFADLVEIDAMARQGYAINISTTEFAQAPGLCSETMNVEFDNGCPGLRALIEQRCRYEVF